MHGCYITHTPSAGKLKQRVCAFSLGSELYVTVLPVTAGKSAQAPQRSEIDLLVSHYSFPPVLQKVILDKQLTNSVSFECLEKDCSHTAEKLLGTKPQ